MKLFFAMLALALLAPVLPAGEPAVTNKPPCCATNAPSTPGAFSATSLYQLNSTWTTDAGKEMKLGALKGKVQVVAMFFSHCEFTCPLTVNDLRRIEAALPESVRGEVGFVLISFDTERDTPEALHAYRTRTGLDSRWTLLRGGADDVQELSLLLGVKSKKDARGQFAHSNLITVLNPAGEIVHQLPGINQDIQSTLSAITQAAGARR
ncbi:MAG: SCO family protein [Verrucomicrobiota bacterium]